MQQAQDFIKSCENRVLVAGYGSLLSTYSRQRYSDITTTTLPATVKGWQRGWLTRGLDEQQQYASAVPSLRSELTACLVPLTFSKDFAAREKDYRFRQISADQIHLGERNNLSSLRKCLEKTPIYICETLQCKEPNEQFPVYFSYLDTCLAGVREQDDALGIERFFATTCGWQVDCFVDDKHEPKYPRAAHIVNKSWDTQALISQYSYVNDDLNVF